MNELKVTFNTTEDAQFTLFCELLMNKRSSDLGRLSKEEIAESILGVISCSYIAYSYGHLLEWGSDLCLDNPQLAEVFEEFIESTI